MGEYRIGILASHPIQYQVPLFRELHRRLNLDVLYAHRQTAADQSRDGYGVEFDWDIDLYSNYEYEFLDNISSCAGVDHFKGCDTPAIYEKIKSQSYDMFIVMGWHLKCYWQAVRACHRHNIPVYARGDSVLDSPRPFIYKALKFITHRWLLKQFDGFLSVGKRNREYLLQYGARPEQIHFCPHHVDNEWFRSQIRNADRKSTLENLGCDPGSFTVLFVGKLIPEKYPLDLINAVKKLCTLNPETKIQIVITGAGPQQPMLEQHARNLNLSVIFTGFKNQSELPRIYLAADVLVLPSIDTWGLVVNEAMACGTPVVVSDRAGCAVDLVERGSTGKIFTHREIDELALAIFNVLKTGKTEQVALAIKNKIDQYSIEKAADCICSLLTCPQEANKGLIS